MPKRGGSRSDIVYEGLLPLLMNGQIPITERLAEEALAERFDVSRTPVREALARLLSDGLVERRDSGLYPKIPPFDAVAELYELRTTLELRGIQRIIDGAAASHDPGVLRPEVASWQQLKADPPAADATFVDHDERFHTTLLRSAGNAELVTALEQVNRRIRPVRMYDYLTPDRMDRTIEEHLQIAGEVLDGKLREAMNDLAAHIETSRAVVVERAAAAFPWTMRRTS
jgi:DNA-binding GntR family transcriptional regulator